MKTTACILLLAAAAWAQEVAVPQGGSLGPSCKLSDAATLGADKLDGSHSSATPAANTVPVADSNGKLAPGWIPLPTGSSIGGIFMSADCLTGNHVSGIDPATGQLKCAGDTADWSNIGNKPTAFPPDTGSQSWQDLLATLALKAASANAALTGTTTAEEIVAATSVQVGSGTPAVNFSYGTAMPTGACTAGMYWRQVSADTLAEFYCTGGNWTASGAGGGGTWGSIAGTLSNQADLQTALNARVPVADKGTANGVATLNASSKVVQDPANAQTTAAGAKIPVAGGGGKLGADWLPLPTASALGGVFISANCGAGNHVNGINLTTGELTCTADTGGSPSADATSLQGRTLDNTAPSSNQFLAWLGSSWGPSSITSTQVSGLGDAATKNTGTTTGTVAAGDDSRITGALAKSGGTMTGTLTLAGNPSATNDASNKGYVDTQIGTRAPTASPTFTGTVSGVTAAMVGLGNVTNVAQMPSSYLDTDTALAANSDTKVASQKATKAYADTKLATSALNAALITSKFSTGGGACSGYLKNDGTCDVSTESTPSLDETTTAGAVHSSKPLEIAGTQTDSRVTEGTAVVVTGENHFSFNSSTHRPSYSFNGGTAKDAAYVGDSILATQLPKPTTSALGGVYSDADCSAGQHFNGIDTATGRMKCAADASSYTLPALTASALGGVKGTGTALACSGTDKVTGFASDGTLQCAADQTSGSTGWITAPATTHDNDTGTYNNDVTVTVGGCSGGTKYVSSDGSTVAAYSTPISVTATATTVKSRCLATGYDPSAVKSSTYTLKVATPTASPAAGTYASTQSVALSSTTTGNYLCYTTDSTDPAGNSSSCSNGTHYTTPISVATTTTVKSTGYKANYDASDIYSGLFTIGAGVSTIFSDGYETNDFTAWTGTSGTPTLASASCPHGTYCMNFPSASAKYSYHALTSDITNGGTIWFRVYFKFSTLPTQNGRILSLANSSWAQDMNVRFDGTATPKTFIMQNSISGINPLTSTQTYSINTIYRLEGFWKLSHTAGQYELKIFTADGTTPIETLTSGATENTWASSTENVHYFAVGNIGGITGVGLVDDAALSLEGYIGPAQ